MRPDELLKMFPKVKPNPYFVQIITQLFLRNRQQTLGFFCNLKLTKIGKTIANLASLFKTYHQRKKIKPLLIPTNTPLMDRNVFVPSLYLKMMIQYDGI
jgi:hypothetical protein